MPEIKDKLVTAESLKNAFDELNNKSYEKLDVTYNKSNNTLVFQNSPELQKKVYVDKTLTKSNNAADAKVTGDAIAELKNENTELRSDIGNVCKHVNISSYIDIGAIEQGGVHPTDNSPTTSNTILRTKNTIYIGKHNTLKIDLPSNWYYSVIESEFDKPYKESIRRVSESNYPYFFTNQNYIRLLFYKHDSAGDRLVITPSDFEGVKLHVDNNVNKVNLFIDDVMCVKNSYLDANGNIVNGNYNTLVAKFPTVKNQRYVVDCGDLYTVALMHNGNKFKMHDMRLFEFVAESSITLLQIYRKDGTLVDTTSDDFKKITITKTNRPSHGQFDVIVCAKDSSEEDKLYADYICDGVNDEVEINSAINSNIFNSYNCNVLLCEGHYNIDSFTLCKDFYLDDANVFDKAYGAIVTRCGCFNMSTQNNRRYRVNLVGKGGTITHYDSGAVLKVSSSVIAKMANDVEYSVLTGARPDKTKKYGYAGYCVLNRYENINVIFEGYNKQMIAFDGIANYGFHLDGCRARTSLGDNIPIDWDEISLPNVLCGVRGDCGEDVGHDTIIKNTYVLGFNEGFAILGEHLLMESCNSHWNNVGISVGNYDAYAFAHHSNTFIGNTIERCGRLMVLNVQGATKERTCVDAETKPIIYIGGTTEMHWTKDNRDIYTKPIKEIIKGAYKGVIDMNTFDMVTQGGQRFKIAEDDSCVLCKVTDTSVRKRLTTTFSAKPDYTLLQSGTELWDTVNNRMLYSTPNGWVTSDGTLVN